MLQRGGQPRCCDEDSPHHREEERYAEPTRGQHLVDPVGDGGPLPSGTVYDGRDDVVHPLVAPLGHRGGDIAVQVVSPVIVGEVGEVGGASEPAVGGGGQPASQIGPHPVRVRPQLELVAADDGVAPPEAAADLMLQLRPDADRVRADLAGRLAASADGLLAGAAELADLADTARADDLDGDIATAVAERRYEWVHHIVAAVVHRPAGQRPTVSDRVDQVLTSRWLGVPIFLAVMWGVFVATTRLA